MSHHTHTQNLESGNVIVLVRGHAAIMPGQQSPHSFALSLSEQGTNDAFLIAGRADMLVPSKEEKEEIVVGGEGAGDSGQFDVCWSSSTRHPALYHTAVMTRAAGKDSSHC